MPISKQKLFLIAEILRDNDDSSITELLANLGNRASSTRKTIELCAAELSIENSSSEDDTRIKGYVEEVIPRYSDGTFQSHFRMSRAAFEVLCRELAKVQTNTAQPKTPIQTKVLLTLWLLGNVESFQGVADRFDVGKATAHHFVMEIVKLLHKLKPIYMYWPDVTSLERMSLDFEEQYGFPNVVGCIDGKHIKVKPPLCYREGFINRNGWPSINVLAVCNNHMAFTYVYADRPGSWHDARVFGVSQVPQLLASLSSQYHILGDSAYPLLPQLMTPYRENGHLPNRQRKFNRYHSSTRCVIEKAFRRLTGKFRRLKDLDMARINLAPMVIESCFILHNFILAEDKSTDSNEDEESDMSLEQVDEEPADQSVPCAQATQKRSGIAATLT